MRIEANIKGIPGVRKYLLVSGQQVAVARTRAIRETLKSVRTKIKKEAAKVLKVPQKALTPRMFISKLKNGEAKGKLWAGTWYISPYAIGKPSQGKTGVTGVRGRRYRGAFLKKIYGGQENIWIRRSSKRFDANLYPGRRGKAGSNSLPAGLRGRFPVVKAAIPIEEAMGKTFDRNENEIRQDFYRKLRREINYALHIEGKK